MLFLVFVCLSIQFNASYIHNSQAWNYVQWTEKLFISWIFIHTLNLCLRERERMREKERVERECLNTPSFSPLSSNFSSLPHFHFLPSNSFHPSFSPSFTSLSLSLTHFKDTQSIFTKPFSPRKIFSHQTHTFVSNENKKQSHTCSALDSNIYNIMHLDGNWERKIWGKREKEKKRKRKREMKSGEREKVQLHARLSFLGWLHSQPEMNPSFLVSLQANSLFLSLSLSLSFSLHENSTYNFHLSYLLNIYLQDKYPTGNVWETTLIESVDEYLSGPSDSLTKLLSTSLSLSLSLGWKKFRIQPETNLKQLLSNRTNEWIKAGKYPFHEHTSSLMPSHV